MLGESVSNLWHLSSYVERWSVRTEHCFLTVESLTSVAFSAPICCRFTHLPISHPEYGLCILQAFSQCVNNSLPMIILPQANSEQLGWLQIWILCYFLICTLLVTWLTPRIRSCVNDLSPAEYCKQNTQQFYATYGYEIRRCANCGLSFPHTLVSVLLSRGRNS